MSKEFQANIATVITELIDLKSKKDGKKFTPYLLAKAIGSNKSLVTRIVNGEVENPRLDTVTNIISYFHNIGLPVSLDWIIRKEKDISISDQMIDKEDTYELSIFLMNDFSGFSVGKININLPYITNGVVAIVATDDMQPFFKKGSVFILDMSKTPKNENMILARGYSKSLKLFKYIVDNNEKYLLSFDNNEKLELDSSEYEVIGVVIKINAKS